jgi:hypothetical protein
LQSILFSEWLLKHSPAAPIESIMVNSTWDSGPRVQLPVQQLKFLRKLDLTSITVSKGDGADPELYYVVGSGCYVLCSALSPLTSLALRNCWISLQGLPALTALQTLTICTPRDASASSNKAALVEALPRLLQLTALGSGGDMLDDDVLAQVSALVALQELKVVEGSLGVRITGSGFAQLPSGLTRLVIECASRLLQPSEPELHISASSTPALLKLTALQELRCANVASFQCELLTALTGLTKLVASQFTAAAHAPRLVMLTGLMRLQHLELLSFDSNNPPALQHEDFAAITSSPQLTHLHIGLSSVDPEEQEGFVLCHTQNGGRNHVLPCMRALRIPTAWLSCPEDMETTARCCPNLEQLSLACDGLHLAGALGADNLFAMNLRHFCEVSTLTRLDLCADDGQDRLSACVCGMLLRPSFHCSICLWLAWMLMTSAA